MSGAPLLDELEDEPRQRFLRYTRKAFGMLPEMAETTVLDIGCRAGIPTLELAEISGGAVIGLDTDEAALEKLESRAREAGLEGRVTTRLCSMADIDVPDQHFDLIWAEGSIQFIGFRSALTRWRRLLKPGRFLVLHGQMEDSQTRIQLAPSCGYGVTGHFPLPEEAWWDELQAVLEQRLSGLCQTYEGDREAGGPWTPRAGRWRWSRRTHGHSDPCSCFCRRHRSLSTCSVPLCRTALPGHVSSALSDRMPWTWSPMVRMRVSSSSSIGPLSSAAMAALVCGSSFGPAIATCTFGLDKAKR